MPLLFVNRPNESWPEERLFSWSVCFEFVFKLLRWCQASLHNKERELFVLKIALCRRFGEHSVWPLERHLTEVTPHVGVLRNGTLQVVGTGRYNAGFFPRLGNDPLAEVVHETESLRTSWFDKDEHPSFFQARPESVDNEFSTASGRHFLENVAQDHYIELALFSRRNERQ